jgi:hypothetical protein
MQDKMVAVRKFSLVFGLIAISYEDVEKSTNKIAIIILIVT